MADAVFLGVDLGASSGRVMAGLFDGSRIRLEEVSRFTNGPVVANDHMFWDVLCLWDNLQRGLQLAGTKYGDQIVSVGVDTWGVDFALLGPGDELLGNPYHYRDRRTAGGLERAFATVSRSEIFAETGVQFMELNSLYQLLAFKEANPRLLEMAETFLMIPDLLNWLLTGKKSNEFTNATTTQFFNPHQRDWSRTLFDGFGLPTRMLQEIIPPGTSLGPIRPSITATYGIPKMHVVAPGTHDTASAVMAVPVDSAAAERSWCYISSGTWSLMGIESADPIINTRCNELNFTNEGGVGRTTRVLKNIAGLWLVQECRRIWQQQGREYSWDQLTQLAHDSAPLVSLIDPDASRFVAPSSMPDEIRASCQQTSQPIPASEGAIIRTALESLALRYRRVLEWLEDLQGHPIETIHIVGGGTENTLLCQMTADACNRQVIAGPSEATVIGNVMMQAVASGAAGSIVEARQIIRNSVSCTTYDPDMQGDWESAFVRFKELSTS